MVRQNYQVNSNDKNIEVFDSYGGGMVTQAHPEKLRNHESVLVENADILAGGVVTNRGAYAQTNNSGVLIEGNSQGFFKYVGTNGATTDIIAIHGDLYKVIGNAYTNIPITGMPVGFQSSRPIEAVQLRDKLYIATGSGLVEYDGSTAVKVTPYTPTGLEALYIGTNGLAANPDTYLTDSTGAGNVILGVTTSVRYGVMNVPVTFTAYVQKVASDTLEYQFETKTTDDVEYKVDQGFSTFKTFTKTFTARAEYMVRVTIRKQGTTLNLSQYVIPRYRVNSTPEENPAPAVTGSNLDTCNRLFIHYDRLWIYGDTSNPDFVYISHLNKFTYFPRTNTIKVTDPLRGSLNNVTRYKDFLVCFTDGSIQLITGTNPKNFEKQPLHTTLGTKQAYSIQIMRNSIVFVGNDNGVYVLRSFNYASNDKMNVERIDDSIKDVIENDVKSSTKILSCMYNNQYYLYTENGNTKRIYRYYHETGVWVRDTIPFTLATMDTINNVIWSTSKTNGTIYQLKRDVYMDGTANTFSMKLYSKNFNFDEPHHRKRMKEYQILTKIGTATTINVKLYADKKLLTEQNLSQDPTQDSDAEKLKIRISGRFRTIKTELVIPVTEEVQVTGFGFIFKRNTPK